MKIYYSLESVPEFSDLSPQQLYKLAVESRRSLFRNWKFIISLLFISSICIYLGHYFGGNIGRFMGGLIALFSLAILQTNMMIIKIKELLAEREMKDG
jgi:hypothetical protein